MIAWSAVVGCGLLPCYLIGSGPWREFQWISLQSKGLMTVGCGVVFEGRGCVVGCGGLLVGCGNHHKTATDACRNVGSYRSVCGVARARNVEVDFLWQGQKVVRLRCVTFRDRRGQRRTLYVFWSCGRGIVVAGASNQ